MSTNHGVLPAIPHSILSRRTRPRYQRDANTRANGRSNETITKKEFRDSIALTLSSIFDRYRTRPQPTIGLVPFPRTYIDRRERPRAEKTTTSLPLSVDNAFLFLTLSSSRRIADAISISMESYQKYQSIFSLFHDICYLDITIMLFE